MKTLLAIALFICSVPAVAINKQPTVILVPQQQAEAPHRITTIQPSNTSIQVIQQQLSDLSQAEARRDAVDQMLIQSLSGKVNEDGSRIDKLETEAATIGTVGGLALTLLLAFAGWQITTSSERHKENREVNRQIVATMQTLSTAVAVIESKLDIHPQS